LNNSQNYRKGFIKSSQSPVNLKMMKRVSPLQSILPITSLLIIAVIVAACAPAPASPALPATPAAQPPNPTANPVPKTPAATVSQGDNVQSIKVGDNAPDFELKDLDGNYVKLSSFKGKKVLLNMWWLNCKGCTGEVQYFQEINDKWSQNELIVLAISVYDRDDIIRAYAQNNKLSYTMLVDPDKQLNKSYVVHGVPTTFFIDGDGIVRAIKDGAFNDAEEINTTLKSL
jgi:peroxiredoxin